MRKRNYIRVINYPALVLFTTLFQSCDMSGPLYPEENPVKFTYEAQTKVTKVKNLRWLTAETDKDIVMENTIENDWIHIYHNGYPENREVIKITVKENNTGQSRSYNLGLESVIHTETLHIVQEPK